MECVFEFLVYACVALTEQPPLRCVCLSGSLTPKKKENKVTAAVPAQYRQHWLRGKREFIKGFRGTWSSFVSLKHQNKIIRRTEEEGNGNGKSCLCFCFSLTILCFKQQTPFILIWSLSLNQFEKLLNTFQCQGSCRANLFLYHSEVLIRKIKLLLFFPT